MGQGSIFYLPTRSTKVYLITAHKPLLPLFNKPKAKFPPRIEKWVMDMQDVDFEMNYEPGKDEADPLDFLSRHPLPVVGNNDTEKILKATIETEHAVVLDRIREETHQDRVLQKLSQTIKKGNWETSKKDVNLAPFYPIKNELYEAQGMIIRMEVIVLPKELQQKVIKSGHKLGHLGHCFDCQVTTKDRRQEPIKPSVIPKEPWEEISLDFGSPYPDGHYNLVAIDQRTRYPEMEGKTGLDRNMAFSDMLIEYRDTPHPATGITPYQAMSNRPIRPKLDHTVPRERSEQDDLIDEKDQLYKEKMGRDSVNVKEHNFTSLSKVIILKTLLQTDHQGMLTKSWESFPQLRRKKVLLLALLLPE
ncbi:hypothetical protein ACROYT_G035707 [Oculina patagonica]